MTKTTDSDVKTKAQIKRLAGFAGFENYKEELLRIASRDSNSDEHLGKVVTSIIDSRRPNESGFTSCPTPAELSDALKAIDNSGQFQSARKDCQECGGTSYRMRWAQYQGEMVQAAERCPCTIRGAA